MNDSQTDRPVGLDDLYARNPTGHLEPPERMSQMLRYLGPGLILTGSIVGSGELIMTTKLGAQAGFVMLWFVVLSCVIKVVVQGELVRHVISSGETYLEIFNKLPGPSWPRPSWLTLEWLAVVLITSLTAATIYMRNDRTPAGGVMTLAGSLAIMAVAAWLIKLWRGGTGNTVPAVAAGKPATLNWFLWIWALCQMGMFINGGAILGGAGQTVQLAFPNVFGEHGATGWSVLVAILCAVMLLGGRYQFLERVSVGLVATFTLITIICTVLLQWTDNAISVAELRQGLLLHFPTPLQPAVVLTALAVYAGTGIGHWEMLSYTYWCIEKGYARNTGTNQPGDEWPRRARGWVRVMYIDSLATMVVYTLSSICFYLLGAAILFRQGFDPKSTQTLAVLQQIYTTSLGSWAATLFIVGAFFILFSTTLSGVASGSRILADAFCVAGFIDRRDYRARLRLIRIAIVVSLALHGYAYFLFEDPPLMLVISSLIAVFMYPVSGLGTIYLSHRRVDRRILPGKVVTGLLWISGLALAIISPAVAVITVYLKWTS